MQEAIKQVLSSKGWEYIQGMFIEEQIKLCDCRTIKEANMEEFGKTAYARGEASEIIDKVIKRIDKFNTEDIPRKKYI